MALLGNLLWDECCPRCKHRIQAFSDIINSNDNIRCCRSCGLQVVTSLNPKAQKRDFFYVITYGACIMLFPRIVSAFLAVVFLALSAYQLFRWKPVRDNS